MLKAKTECDSEGKFEDENSYWNYNINFDKDEDNVAKTVTKI